MYVLDITSLVNTAEKIITNPHVGKAEQITLPVQQFTAPNGETYVLELVVRCKHASDDFEEEVAGPPPG